MSERDAQAVVVGGGLTGIATAVTLARAGLSTIHLAPEGPADRRTSALMLPAVRFLADAGLIQDPATIGHPLTQIRIIDATSRLLRAPETLFDAAQAGLDAFGWNFANARLTERFHAVAQTLPNLTTRNVALAQLDLSNGDPRLTLADGTTLLTQLVVGADGKKSAVRTAAGLGIREHNFGQSALVCDLTLTRPLGGASVEFHYPHGPFTLVPAGDNRANLVWIDQQETLKAAQALGPDALTALLLEKSQRLFGAITMATSSFIFPLSTLTVSSAGTNGVVLVGEAAHAFPPIGAQGLNLGLRDVADLSDALAQADYSAPDWADKLSVDYAARRATDLHRTGAMVDTLFRSLLAEMLPAQALRAAGLWALKLSPSLRKQAFGLGMGQR